MWQAQRAAPSIVPVLAVFRFFPFSFLVFAAAGICEMASKPAIALQAA